MSSIYTPKGLYIDGAWVGTPDSLPVINPADESVIASAPVGTGAHADAAIAAARRAFDSGDWSHLAPKARQAILQRFVDASRARAEDIKALLVAEVGATQRLIAAIQFEIPLRHAQHCVDLTLRDPVTPLPIAINPVGRGSLLGAGVMIREPVGVVTAITPYNFPFYLNIGKVMQALAVGCTVVLKPSPYTPLTALILGEIAEAAGLPHGVLNIVTGEADVGEKLTTDPRIDLISFTGSDKVGALIQAQAAPTLKRCLLELGGKSALIVRHDADIKSSAVIGSAFTVHCGQGCALTTRHLVHNAVRAEYVAALKAQVEKMTIGDPQDPKVVIGPLIREAARARTETYAALALDEGATLVTGGARPEALKKGFFYKPTIFDNVQNSNRVAREEIFGPIACVIGFDSDEEAIALANDSEFGLSGAIQSADAAKAYEMALRIRTGGLTINGGTGNPLESTYPFGGVKRSGYGRENGIEGLNEYTYIKTIGFHAA